MKTMIASYTTAFAVLFAVSGCANGATDSAANWSDPAKIGGQRCKVATEIAKLVAADNYDPALDGGGNCQAEFAAAGVPMLGLKKPGDPAGAAGLDHITRLGPITRLDGSSVKVGLSYVCPRLCGHGEEIVAALKDGHWTITSRRNTWIS